MDDSRWLRRLKNALAPLQRTPLHPQWLAAISADDIGAWIAATPPGTAVLDIGCGGQWPRGRLPPSCSYVGIDHPASAAWYGTRPSAFADAHALPFADGSLGTVLMLDVLEHLHDPERAVAEARRVLAPGGRLVLQVPFLYPVHDAPNDHTRWTPFGQRRLAERAGFEIVEQRSAGTPVATAALLGNIALAHAVLLAVRRRRPGALLAPLLPLAVLAINLTGWLLARLLGPSELMPFSCRALWRRAERAATGEVRTPYPASALPK